MTLKESHPTLRRLLLVSFLHACSRPPTTRPYLGRSVSSMSTSPTRARPTSEASGWRKCRSPRCYPVSAFKAEWPAAATPSIIVMHTCPTLLVLSCSGRTHTLRREPTIVASNNSHACITAESGALEAHTLRCDPLSGRSWYLTNSLSRVPPIGLEPTTYGLGNRHASTALRGHGAGREN